MRNGFTIRRNRELEREREREVPSALSDLGAIDREVKEIGGKISKNVF